LLRIVDDAARKRDNVEMNASRSYPTRSTIGQPRVPGGGRQEARPDRRRAARVRQGLDVTKLFHHDELKFMFKFKFHVELARRPCLHKKQYMYTYVKIDALQGPGEGALLEALLTDYLKHAPREYEQFMFYSM